MPFSSYSDFIAELSAGKRFRTTFAKSSANAAAGVAYRMYELFSSPTFVPGGQIWSGSAGVGTACTGATVGALDLGPTLASGETRHLLNAMLYSPTTTMFPGMAYLVDFLAYHPACVVTGTPSTLSAVSLPRYTTGDEVMASVFVQAVLGAATPSLTITFVDSGGTSRTATMVSPTNSLPIQTAFMNGTSWWFNMPAVAGRNGVRSLTSYTINSGGTTGTVCMVLYKIIATIPLLTLGTPVERDFAVQLPSLPMVEDQAWASTPCLGWIVIPGGAMITAANLSGHIETCYG
jgi:hypothetical protein